MKDVLVKAGFKEKYCPSDWMDPSDKYGSKTTEFKRGDERVLVILINYDKDDKMSKLFVIKRGEWCVGYTSKDIDNVDKALSFSMNVLQAERFRPVIKFKEAGVGGSNVSQVGVSESVRGTTVKHVQQKMRELGIAGASLVNTRNKDLYLDRLLKEMSDKKGRCEESKRVKVEIVEETYQDCGGEEMIVKKRKSKISTSGLTPSTDLHSITKKYISDHKKRG